MEYVSKSVCINNPFPSSMSSFDHAGTYLNTCIINFSHPVGFSLQISKVKYEKIMARFILIAAPPPPPPPLFQLQQRYNKEIIQKWNSSTRIKGAEIEVHKHLIAKTLPLSCGSQISQSHFPQSQVAEAELCEDIPPELSCGRGTLGRHSPWSRVEEAELNKDIPPEKNCGSGPSCWHFT